MKKEEYHNAGIDAWPIEFYRIYRSIDRKRNVQDVWLQLVEDSSKVAEAIRKDEYGDALEELAHVFCWLCSFIEKCRDKEIGENKLSPVYLFDEKLSDILWYKFPGICWKCGSVPCMCPIRRFEIEKERDKEVINGKLEEFRLATFRKPKSLDDWANMFEMIYKNVHYGAPIEKICFHFMEEVGEVAKAIRKLNYYSKKDMGCLTSDERTDIEKLRRDMQNEIADVFSWIVSLKMKLNFLSQVILKYHKHYYENVELHIIKLSDSVWNIFQTPDGTELFCPHCRKKVCKCPII